MLGADPQFFVLICKSDERNLFLGLIADKACFLRLGHDWYVFIIGDKKISFKLITKNPATLHSLLHDGHGWFRSDMVWIGNPRRYR